jgi:2-polyprenyl-6-methoxyphenol hydroxylase-like FAD-dependent oxidoreductase
MLASTRRRAIVIGGSLGGLFAAHLLLRDAWDVHVFEHSRENLVGRGAGIITHPELFQCLEQIGIEIDESFGVEVPGRVAFDRAGRVLGAVPLRQCLTTWGRLYELLKAAFPADRYHFAHTLERVTQTTHSVVAHFESGAQAEAELLIGADGIRSTVRAQFLPDTRPVYAGYIAWRGLAGERELTQRTHADLFPLFAFSLAEREQMLGYPVAGFTRSTRPGERCYNFVWYRPTTESALCELCTDVNGREHDMSVPPVLIRPDALHGIRKAAHALLAPQFAEVVEQAVQPFFQAIFDVQCASIAFGRIALLGDAAFVARPHCGMGVTKAAGDAMALVRLLRSGPTAVPAALSEYEAARLGFGAAVVAHARQLGSYLSGSDTGEARDRHTPHAVMRDIAVTRHYLA